MQEAQLFDGGAVADFPRLKNGHVMQQRGLFD
jgi:hypothetical protein